MAWFALRAIPSVTAGCAICVIEVLVAANVVVAISGRALVIRRALIIESQQSRFGLVDYRLERSLQAWAVVPFFADARSVDAIAADAHVSVGALASVDFLGKQVASAVEDLVLSSR